MDANGGSDPLNQTYGTGQDPVSLQPVSQQQSPMSGPQVAYDSQVTGQYVSQPASQTQVPLQDVRPGWQQDLQYTTPVDPPWVKDPAATNYSQESTTIPAGAHQPQITPSAYNLLLEPVPDMPISSTGGRKPVVMVIVVLLVLMLSGGAAMLAYTGGYNKGLAEGKAMQKTVAAPEEEAINEDTDKDIAEEPSLDFETTESSYKQESLSGEMKEQLQASDGLVVMVSSLDRDYKVPDLDEVTDLEFVRINMLIGNADSKNAKVIKDATFTVVDTEGNIVGALRSDLAFEGQSKGDLTIEPGATKKTSLLFEVTRDQMELTLLRRQSYKLGTETRSVEMAILLTSESTVPSSAE